MDIAIRIKKHDVFEEVAKTTSYIGAKKIDGDEASYERIFTTDADRDMIERYWREAADIVTTQLQRYISHISPLSISNTPNMQQDYEVELELPSRFDENLVGSISSSIYSFFVNCIVYKWCEITDKDNAKEYAETASALLLDIKGKIFTKKKPTRAKI